MDSLISIMKRAISKQFDSLTENTPAYKMVAIPNEEVETKKGKVYPHRSGFRVYWPLKGETFWFYQDQFGKPFK